MTITARTAVQNAGTAATHAFTLPTGTAAGDFVALCMTVNASGQTVTQTGGTGTFTILSGNDGSGAHTYVFAYRLLQSGDTAPTLSWTTSTNYDSAIESWTSSINNMALDAAGTVATTGTAGNSITVNSVAGAASGEASLILSLAHASTANAQSSHTWTPCSGYANRENSESSSSPFRFVGIDDNLSTSSATVAPGSESLTDSGSNTFFFSALQILITDASGPTNVSGSDTSGGAEGVPALIGVSDVPHLVG